MGWLVDLVVRSWGRQRQKVGVNRATEFSGCVGGETQVGGNPYANALAGDVASGSQGYAQYATVHSVCSHALSENYGSVQLINDDSHLLRIIGHSNLPQK